MYLSIYQFSSGPLVTGFQSWHLLVYWVVGVKFLCFVTLSTSFSHFTSGRPHHHLSSVDQVIIWLCHLLSSMCITHPYYFNMLSSALSKIVCITHILSLMNWFLTYSIYWIQKAFGETNTLRILFVSINHACLWYYILDLKNVIAVFLLPCLLPATLVSKFRPSCQYAHVYVKSLM